jgi:hypothetical protein
MPTAMATNGAAPDRRNARPNMRARGVRKLNPRRRCHRRECAGDARARFCGRELDGKPLRGLRLTSPRATLFDAVTSDGACATAMGDGDGEDGDDGDDDDGDARATATGTATTTTGTTVLWARFLSTTDDRATD